MSDEFAFAPTAAQTAAMTAMKALAPGVHWHQVYNLLRSSYPDDFKDNDHDIYVVANHYAGVPGPPPAEVGPPPTVTVLNPATGPANTDITVSITGTGFGAGATVNIGTAHSLVPTNITPTDLTVLFSGAAHIQYPGVLPVSVQNADGQVSNTLDFTVT
jgi:IPT/TIG domain